MTWQWPWTRNGQRHPVYAKYLACSLVCLLSTIKRFSRYKVVENRKYTEWPQNDLEHFLTVKSTLYS